MKKKLKILLQSNANANAKVEKVPNNSNNTLQKYS